MINVIYAVVDTMPLSHDNAVAIGFQMCSSCSKHRDWLPNKFVNVRI